VGAVEDVDRIEMQAADIFDEAREARRGERGRLGPREVLPLEEERGDGAQRNTAAWHAAELIIVVTPCPG
jgi:hypothetical protein